MMTEQEYMAAVDAAVTRWRQDRAGEPLTCLFYAEALPAHCHDNAATHVSRHGGQVVHGFLVQHPQDWPMVWVMAHSVVRADQGLMDITLKQADLAGLAFFEIDGDLAGFTEWAKRYPQESRPIVAAPMSQRSGPDGSISAPEIVLVKLCPPTGGNVR